MAKKSGSKMWWIGAVVVVGGALAYGLGPGAWFAKTEHVELRGARVKRGPLSISVVQRGNLAAKDAVSVKSELEGQTTILYLIPEGTHVKPGDLLCELDASDLVERKLAQEISLQSAEAAFTKARAQYDIQDSQNKSDIEAAERRLKFAQIDLDKYVKGDYAQQVKQADDKILLAQQKRTQAKTTVDFSQELAASGFITKTELDRDDLDFQSADVQLAQAIVAKDLFQQYDDPRKRTELEANLREAERGLERAELRAQSLIVDYEAGLKSSEAKLKLEREKFAKYEDQVRKARIVAEASGMVVYSRMEGRGMGGGDPIQEGTQVRERQEILQIPRTGGLIVEASVHESVLKQVAVGMPCRITIDALPGQEFDGSVQYVALLPDKGSWWSNPNQRLYKTEVLLAMPSDPTATEKATYADMRPGMSCGIEILADQIDSCLYVPVQCVVHQRGETIAFVAQVASTEERKVKVGRSNDKFVEVLTGLAEDEEVLLAPPAGFQPADVERTDAKVKIGERPARAPALAGAAPRIDDGAVRGEVPVEGTAASHTDTRVEGAAVARPDAQVVATPAPVADEGGESRGGRTFDPSQMPEEMRKRFEAMSPEERTRMMERFKNGARRGERRAGENGGPGSAGDERTRAKDASGDAAPAKEAGAAQHDDSGAPK
ncbi:MAG: efflux RND transporter periplasmic adaptor subunit [Planctomycetota bacterium]